MRRKNKAGRIVFAVLLSAVMAVGFTACGTTQSSDDSSSSSAASSSSASTSSTVKEKAAVGSTEKAIEKACKKIGIDKHEATESKCEKGRASGKTVYNGFIKYDEFDYDFQIAASNGEFLHWDRIQSTGEMPNWDN